MAAYPVVDLLKAAWGFVAGNLWRTAAIAVAVYAFFIVGALNDARADLATQERLASAASLQADAATSSALQWEASTLQLQGELSACQGRWAAVSRVTQEQLAAARERAAEAEQALFDFRSKWEARSSTCGAMLIEMERACPELADY